MYRVMQALVAKQMARGADAKNIEKEEKVLESMILCNFNPAILRAFNVFNSANSAYCNPGSCRSLRQTRRFL
jgi:hypothetical protein